MKKFLLVFVGLTAITFSRAATFTAIASGSYNAAGTWTHVGADADGIPDNDDDVIVASPFLVTCNATSDAKNLTLNSGGSLTINNQTMRVWGNLTNNGFAFGSGTWQFRAAGTYSGNNLNSFGSVWFYSNYTIAASVSLTKGGGITVTSGATVTNNGNINLNNGGFLDIYSSGKWINANGSSIAVSSTVTNGGIIDCSAATNTFTYNTNGYTIVVGTNATYYNLVINTASAQTKALSNNLVVRNNLTIGTNVTLNWANFNITLGGSWTNSANINCTNRGTITFNGAGTQIITRSATESFTNVTLAGTGTVQLARDVNATGITTLTSGTLNPSTFIYHQKGATFNGNGGLISAAATGKITFDGLINQFMAGTTGAIFGNLEIKDPGFTVQLSRAQTAAGTTTLTSGILDPNNSTFNQTGASWLSNGGTINTAAAGSIAFNGVVPQTIGGSAGSISFCNVSFGNTGTVTLALPINCIGKITLNSGNLDVSASNFAITASRNWVNNGGTLLARTGTVTFNGTVAQAINGAGSTTFYNLTSTNTSGGVNVTSGDITVNNILSVVNTMFSATLPGTCTIPATAVGVNGKIGPLGATASLGGTGWIIKCFINGPAARNWQYLGSPINGNTLADWDNDPRFYMSAVGGNDGTACCPTFYSVRTLTTATQAWVNVTTTATALTACKGFSIWMADNNTTGLTSPLIFDSRGTPNFGNKSIAMQASRYTLVSNPYACPVTFASVVAASTNVNASFMCWQENGSYVTNPNGGVIAATQGFMAYGNAAGTLQFTEACKNVVTNPNVIRYGDPANYLRIRTSNDVNGLGGEAVIQINDDGVNGYDVQDLPFLASMFEDATNVWTTDAAGTDQLLNTIDGRNDNLDVPMTMMAGTQGNQMVYFSGVNNFSEYSCAILEDLKTGKKTNLKEKDNYTYFADQVGEKRNFMLHFSRNGECPLNQQNITPSLDAQTLVFVSNNQIMAKFNFEENTAVEISIFDVDGKQVFDTKNLTVFNESIVLGSPDAHGIYFVRITSADKTSTKKIYY